MTGISEDWNQLLSNTDAPTEAFLAWYCHSCFGLLHLSSWVMLRLSAGADDLTRNSLTSRTIGGFNRPRNVWFPLFPLKIATSFELLWLWPQRSFLWVNMTLLFWTSDAATDVSHGRQPKCPFPMKQRVTSNSQAKYPGSSSWSEEPLPIRQYAIFRLCNQTTMSSGRKPGSWRTTSTQLTFPFISSQLGTGRPLPLSLSQLCSLAHMLPLGSLYWHRNPLWPLIRFSCFANPAQTP